jgi:hypothetical protein
MTDGASVRSARRVSLVTGVGAGLLLVLLALAGADHPPPAGFLWVVLLGAVTAATVRLALPRALTRWESTGAQPILTTTALLGAASGALVVGLAGLLPSAEPSIEVTSVARVLGIAAGAASGAVGALVVVATGRLFHRQTRGSGHR